MNASMSGRGGLGIAILIASVACDGFVRARVRVVSAQGEAIPDALLRLERSTDHDLARFTDDRGCAYFSGVVAPVRHVPVTIGKAGYQSRDLKLRTIQENCLLVHLARDGESGKGSVDTLRPQDCPCDSKAGYSPTMSARFKVDGTDGKALELVALRRSDRPRDPWSQVTDARGCLGVRWIVSAGLRRIPLLLEKPGYQPAQLEVPTMEEQCYAVSLSRAGAPASTVVAIGDDKCGCEMFTGKTVWPDK
jgi:hypothetical protein